MTPLNFTRLEMRFATMAEPYLRLGWPVFPTSRDKRPLTTHGYKDATLDPKKVEEWSRRFPDANISVPTGRISGVIVIDIDGHVGEETLYALAENGLKIDTPLQVTTGRGRHLYFRDDRTMRNSASKVGPGIDIRANGGSITVPPSIHQRGTTYEWTADPETTPIPPVPMGLLLHIYNPRAKPSWGSVPTISISEIVGRVKSAPPGLRNHELNVAAYLAGKTVKSGQSTWEEAENSLLEAGLCIGLKLHECRATVRSGLRAGQEN